MNDQEMEKWKAQHKNQLAQYNAERAAELAGDIEMFKSIIIAGQASLKSAILINGGAAVALLAFTGHVFTTSQDSEVTAKLACAMAYFVGGVISGAVASGLVYVSQFVYARKKLCLGHILNGISWLLVISCYIFFVIGSVLAFRVF